MQYIDVFNGDADGICALHQLRLSQAVDSCLVTGVKRDINLLEKVDAAETDQVMVLDISLDRNHSSLQRILDAGATVTWFDHHFAGDIPQHPGLTAHINTSADVCTSLLVNGHLSGRHYLWAITGAFGDNLHDSARRLAETHGVDIELQNQLAELGMLLNYNGYGARLEDLCFHPADLYRRVAPYENPVDFIAETDIMEILRERYETDIQQAASLEAEYLGPRAAVYLLPDAPWARRIGGVYANMLARANPQRAHALLTRREQGGWLVSVRASLDNPTGADELCRRFPGGGGRKGAAGINELPDDRLTEFIDAFRKQFE